MKNLFNYFLPMIALFLVFSSCKKEDNEPEPVIMNIHITEDITENSVWKPEYTYYVDQSVNVTNNSVLTIEAGTTVKFGDGVALSISYTSSSAGNIIAIGTEQYPIIFTSQKSNKSKGDWDGIWLYEEADESIFKYCKFEYAGGSEWSGGEGAITINYAKNVIIENCSFENSKSYGVRVYKSPMGLGSFKDNNFVENEVNDLKMSAYNVSSIDEGNVFTKDVDVIGSKIDTPGEIFWRNLNTNINIIEFDVEVGSESGTTLIIEAGSNINIAEKTVSIAYYSVNFGMIKAIGTVENPITFSSPNETPQEGDWNSITFYEGSLDGSIFDYCNFSYGGGYVGAPAMIVFKFEQGSTTTISNCHFIRSAGYGVMLDQPTTDTSYPILSGNIFSDNALGDINW